MNETPGAPQPDADVLIVGGGTAGCVLAARLSQDRRRRVLLIEAGPDFTAQREPADVRALYPLSYFNPAYAWPALQACWSQGRVPVPFTQGRLVGGSSAIMGMWAVRGFPDDYDEWSRLGAAGWGWSEVLPHFVRAERDLDFEGALHGRNGPVPIRRQPIARWPPYCRGVAAAATASGLNRIDDMNAQFGEGLCVLPIAATDRRGSAAISYLTSEVRARPNLQLSAGQHARRVLFDGKRAVGVEVQQGRTLRELRAREIVLSAGALHSPLLLLRSGLGAAPDLAMLGVAPVSVRPAVGRNLQNHALVPIGIHLAPDAMQHDTHASAAWFCLRASSGEARACDLYFSVLNRSAWHYFGRRLATLGVMLHKPRSRGRVSLPSADPHALPKVEFDFLSDPRDLQALVHGLRLAAGWLAAPEVAALSLQSGLVGTSRLVRMLRHRTVATRVLDAVGAALFPLMPRLEARLMRQVLGRWPLAQLRTVDDAALAQAVRTAVGGVFHPAGTCRMGAAEDAAAVVDCAGRVHGTQALRVVDASVMPTIPRAGTFLPTIMVAEKIAAEMAQAR